MARWIKVFLAMGFTALLLIFPAEALAAAVQAMTVWASSFAPSLFPFFVVMPALSCPEALRLYEKVLGRVMPALFGVPGTMAGAVAIGWIAGSPAGALAVHQAAGEGDMTPAHQRRAALLSVGVSPMFLMAAVGTGLLGSSGLGLIFVRSQLAALIASGLFFKHFWKNEPTTALCRKKEASGQTGSFMRNAALQMLTVCGWMIFFGVIAKLITAALAVEALEAPLLAVLEVTGGCVAIARLGLHPTATATLICCTCCFGGLSIIAQSMQMLKDCSVKWRHLIGAKVLQAVLGGGFCWLQLRFLAFDAAPAFSYGGAARFSYAAAAVSVVLVAFAVWGVAVLAGWDKTRAARIRCKRQIK